MNSKVDMLISAIYDAATEESRWSELLSLFVDEFDAVGAAYFIFDRNSRQTQFWCTFGHDVTQERLYNDHYIKIDPTLDLAINSEVGKILYSTDHFSKHHIERSEYFQDFLIPSRLGNVTGAKIIDRNGFVGVFSIQHSLDIGPITDERRIVLTHIFPHLVRAAAIHWQMKSLEIKVNVIEGALARSPQAMIVVDNKKRIQYMNSAAESFVSSGCGIAPCGQFLCCADVDREKELKSAVATVTVASQYEARVLHLVRGNMRMFINISPIAFPCPSSTCYGKYALVIASSPIVSPEAFHFSFGDAFALTKAEKTLVYRLFAGGTLTEIASELRLSRETLRSQLHSVFVKTGTNRQSQLISLMQKASTCLPREAFLHK